MYVISLYLIIGGINLDHLVKVVANESLYCKVAIFTFVINTFLVKDGL